MGPNVIHESQYKSNYLFRILIVSPFWYRNPSPSWYKKSSKSKIFKINRVKLIKNNQIFTASS